MMYNILFTNTANVCGKFIRSKKYSFIYLFSQKTRSTQEQTIRKNKIKTLRIRIYIYITLTLLLLQSFRPAFGRDPVFSQFYAAPLYLNPAFAGSTMCQRIAFNYRMLNSIENFHVANFSYDSFVERLEGGVGIMLTSEEANMYMMRNTINAMYAYHLRVSQDVNINFGVQAGYIGNYSRWGKLDFVEEEPEPDHIWRHNVDFAAGVMLFTNKFYGGVAAHHLHEPSMSLYDDDVLKLERKFTGHFGMYFEPGSGDPGRRDEPEYFISPNLIFQQQGYHTHIGAGIYTGIKPVMIGAWARRHWLDLDREKDIYTFVFLAGLNIDDYRIGISYDSFYYGESQFSNVSRGALEISLAFRFNCP
jgi:type IX secretion system PorP/SprF family membrane protein